jgi:hypothetical protein
MPIYIEPLFTILIFLAGLIVFLDALVRITQQFCKRTPILIRTGTVLVAVGAVAFLHDPLWMGFLFLLGRVLLLVGGHLSGFRFLRCGRTS